jgi:ADP-ribose pyrophosphatase YjhB (NUDIX family)
MYKIYINDKPLIICSPEEFPNIKIEAYVTNYELDRSSFHSILQKLNTDKGLIIQTNDTESTFLHLSKNLVLIEAAGGLIFNPNRTKILFIFRRGKWDLPKGKIDEGESIKKAAWREVAEECGLKTHRIEDHLCDTYHIYEHKGKLILKKTYWYLMSAEEEALIPQVEEDITKAEWIPSTIAYETIKGKSYAMIEDLLRYEV